jgi:hypothetical protein
LWHSDPRKKDLTKLDSVDTIARRDATTFR